MTLDLFSVSTVTALVVIVSGVVFCLETLIRRDDGAGRVWALAFLSGMLTTVSYLLWATDPSAWWAVAVGNSAFVAAAGCMWLGCRRFNRRRMDVAAVLVAVGVAAAAVAVVLAGPEGGGWAGALVMFIAICAFAVAGCVESLRGDMGRLRIAWGLAFVLGVQALYYAARSIVFATAGSDSELFGQWFGTAMTSFLTVTLTIVALTVTSVLRASRAELRGTALGSEIGLSGDGILSEPSFGRVLDDITERAQWRGELVGVIAVRIDDLEQIATAFGSEVGRSVTEAWREGVRRHAPSSAPVGEDGPSGLMIAIVPGTAADARREAALIYRGLFEELGSVTGGVIPVVGIGVGLSEGGDEASYESGNLQRIARDAAQRAATSVESSVLVGDE